MSSIPRAITPPPRRAARNRPRPITTSAKPIACATRTRRRPPSSKLSCISITTERVHLAGRAVPVNCYGSSVIAKRGSTAHLTGEADPNLADPSQPGRCFEVGGGGAVIGRHPWRGPSSPVELAARVPTPKTTILSRQRQRSGALRRDVLGQAGALASSPPRRSITPAAGVNWVPSARARAGREPHRRLYRELSSTPTSASLCPA